MDSHDYRLCCNKHKSCRLQQLFNEVNGNGFTFAVLELCDIHTMKIREAYHTSSYRTLLCSWPEGQPMPQVVRDKVSASNKGKPKSITHKTSLATAQRRRFTDLVQRELAREAAEKGRKSQQSDPNFLTNRSEAAKRQHADPEKRRLHGLAIKEGIRRKKVIGVPNYG